VNARDAMPRGGELTIATRNETLESGTSVVGVPPGAYVVISVIDTGTGMTEAVKERIFEPFFTTKDRDKGTGLGLAMVFGFVRQSGGHVRIDSEIDRGTTVRIYLPRALVATPEAPSLVPEPLPHVHATVLVVEDNEKLR